MSLVLRLYIRTEIFLFFCSFSPLCCDKKGRKKGQTLAKWITSVLGLYIRTELFLSSKTIAEGRRIGASKACENPTCIEIVDCCKHLKIPCAIELDKAYPRDFMQRGRVRVLLKRGDGSLYNHAIGSRIQQNETKKGEVDDARRLRIKNVDVVSGG
ncbi:Signal recognition particle 19 kDa protein [Platanthera guangdongensis]|uniref:Signal recognition particle 19 kDa protein n=1 Tax=Platanthera guangdongensis TaxID=2320717 RepID=A0ABR2MCE4_9ASPA